MKYQILFSTKNKKNIISLSSAEFVHSMVSVKGQTGEKHLTGNREQNTGKPRNILTKIKMGHNVRKRKFGHVGPAKIQIRQCICTV